MWNLRSTCACKLVDIEVQTGLEAYMDIKSPLSKSRTSPEAYIDFKFYISKSRTSLQAYFDFKFHPSQSRTSLEGYIDLEFHISKPRTTELVYKPKLTSIVMPCLCLWQVTAIRCRRDAPPKIWCSSEKGFLETQIRLQVPN